MKRINPYKLFVGCFVPNWLMVRKEISHGGKLCYARLAQYAGKHGVAHPSQPALAAQLCVSARQVRSYISELTKYKLIESQQEGYQGTNTYYFLWHEWMDEPSLMEEESNEEESFHINQSRKDTSSQGGNILPPKAEENFLPERKDPSSKENQLREKYKETTNPPNPPEGDTEKVRKSRGEGRHLLRDNYEMTANMQAWFTNHTPGVDPFETLGSMRDWAKSNRVMKADWDATLRNFARRAYTQGHSSRSSPRTTSQLSKADDDARWQRIIHEVEVEEQEKRR